MINYSVAPERGTVLVVREDESHGVQPLFRYPMKQQAESVARELNRWAFIEGDATVDAYAPGPRALSAIAADIRAHWPKVYFGAVPYLDAMSELDKISDMYYADTAESVVRYFLANATTWRGEDARRVKAELKAMLASLPE